jgi:hypothetical protein
MVWAAIITTMICCPAVLVAAGDNTLPPDLKPMLEHAAIVAEMMHACRHTYTLNPDCTGTYSVPSAGIHFDIFVAVELWRRATARAGQCR